MTAPKARNGGGANGSVQLDDIINPKRRTVGVVSKDTTFRDVAADALSEKGFSPRDLTLELLVGGGPIGEDILNGFYLIDLTDISDYGNVEKAVEAIRTGSPDSGIVVVGTEADLSSPKSARLRKTTELHIIPLYGERPESVGLPTMYGKKLKSFIGGTSREDGIADYFNAYLSKPSIIKVGGSVFDLAIEQPVILQVLLDEIKKLHSLGYPIILTAGRGPRGNIDTDLSQALGTEPDSLSVLERQAKQIVELLNGDRSGNGVAVYVPPGEVQYYNFSRSKLSKYVHVVSLSGVKGLPHGESDTHTLAIAELLGAHKVVFVKHTDGVFRYDPNVSDQATLFDDPGEMAIGSKNQFYPVISASDVLNGVVKRKGADRKNEHLIESGALIYLRDGKVVRAVHVFNGTRPEQLRMALDGSAVGRVGSYILKG